jgi:hypothetical protein
MQISEGYTDGLQPFDDAVGGEAAVLVEEALQVYPVNIRADEVLAGLFEDKVIEDGRELGVAQVAEAAGFGAEPFLDFDGRVEVFLDGTVAFGLYIPGAVNRAVLAFGQEADDAVAFVEEFTGEEGHGKRLTQRRQEAKERRGAKRIARLRWVKRIMDTGMNVVYGKIGIAVQDNLGEGKPIFKQLKDIMNWNTSTGDIGFAEMDIGINNNSFCHGF